MWLTGHHKRAIADAESQSVWDSALPVTAPSCHRGKSRQCSGRCAAARGSTAPRACALATLKWHAKRYCAGLPLDDTHCRAKRRKSAAEQLKKASAGRMSLQLHGTIGLAASSLDHRIIAVSHTCTAVNSAPEQTRAPHVLCLLPYRGW